MDKYFLSESFQQKLSSYQTACREESFCDLDVDDLGDIIEYYAELNKQKEALQAIDYTLSLYPDSTMALCYKARYALVVEGNAKKARQIIGSISDETDVDYLFLMAEIHLNAAGEADQADDILSTHLDTIINEDDRNDFCLDAAKLFLDYNYISYAERWLNDCTDKEDEMYIELHYYVLRSKEQWAACEALLNKQLDKNPYDADCWVELANIQLCLRHTEDSITSCEYALAIDPNHWEALYCKGTGLCTLDNYKDALTYFDRCYPMATPGLQCRINVIRGYAYFASNDKEKAQYYLNKALEEAIDKDEVKQEIGMVLIDFGAYQEAYDTLQSIKTGDDLEGYYCYLAFCCYKLNREDEYNEYQQKAYALDREYAKKLLFDLFSDDGKIHLDK